VSPGTGLARAVDRYGDLVERTSTAAACLFCGERGSSREDVFALWISALFAAATPFALKTTAGRNKTDLVKFAVYSRAACVDCNTGWMSSLEQNVKPLLSPALFGQHVAWDADEQLLVAAWAFKTGLMLDRSNLTAQKVPLAHFRYLRDHQRPPDASQVSLGVYRPDPGQPHQGATAGVGAGPESHRDSYRISFSVGQAVFVVHGHAGDGRAFQVQQSSVLPSRLWVPLWNTLPCLWPRTATVFRWPPPDGFALNNDSLERLSDNPLMEPFLIRP